MRKLSTEISTVQPLSTASNGGFGYGFATYQNPSWTLEQLLEGCSGTLLFGETQAGFRSISTDSRTVKPGDVFVALSGDNYDGEKFIKQAVKDGAACVITSQALKDEIPVSCILVKDTLKALGDLASFRRKLVGKLKVLAITGSSGKTTVKEMTAAILAKSGNVIKTKGNFNNLVGLPLSLLPVTYRHDFAVLEMGMNRPGEIARLTQIATPDVACILNIHGAHLEGLGSVEGVARAKGELFAGCDKSATLAVNIDDKRVEAIASEKSSSKITFGFRKKAFVRATKITSKGKSGMGFKLNIGDKKAKVRIKAYGKHNVSNSLAAAAMAHAVGVEMSSIVEGLEDFKPSDKRLVVELFNGLNVVNDSYNANPASMKAALLTVCDMKKNAKAVAVLGDMLELGKHSETAHKEVGKIVANSGYDYLLAVGNYADTTSMAARSAGMKQERVRRFDSKKQLCEFLAELLRKKKINSNDYLLFKGSRGMAMETIIEDLFG